MFARVCGIHPATSYQRLWKSGPISSDLCQRLHGRFQLCCRVVGELGRMADLRKPAARCQGSIMIIQTHMVSQHLNVDEWGIQ